MCVIGVLERVELLFSLSWTLLFLSKGKQTALVAIKPTSKSPVSSPATIFFFSNTDTVFKTEWMSWWEQCQVSQKFSMMFIWQGGSLSLSTFCPLTGGGHCIVVVFFEVRLKCNCAVFIITPPLPPHPPSVSICHAVHISDFVWTVSLEPLNHF